MVLEWRGHAGLGSAQQCRWLGFLYLQVSGQRSGLRCIDGGTGVVVWDAGRDVIRETRESAQPSRSGRQLHGEPRMFTRLGRLSRDLSLKVC